MSSPKFTLLLLFPLILSASPTQTGIASWYGEELRGHLMANGQPFDPDALTCASWDYPFGTRLLVRHKTRSVVVTVTDRGPNKRLNRAIDLSRASFAKLAHPDIGLIHVEIFLLTPDQPHLLSQSQAKPKNAPSAPIRLIVNNLAHGTLDKDACHQQTGGGGMSPSSPRRSPFPLQPKPRVRPRSRYPVRIKPQAASDLLPSLGTCFTTICATRRTY